MEVLEALFFVELGAVVGVIYGKHMTRYLMKKQFAISENQEVNNEK